MSALATMLLLPLAANIALWAPASEPCDFNVRMHGSRTSISSHDSDDRTPVIDYVKVHDGRCTSATIVGRLTFSSAEDDIVAIPFGGHAVFRERGGSTDRAMSFSRGPDGQVVRSYQENGRAASYDSDAQRWFTEFLPRILTEAAMNVGPRIARWRSQGGVDNVVSEIADIGSSGARRTHYVALLDDGRLSNDDHERVLRGMSRTLRESSGDMRSVLTKAKPTFRLSKASVSALEDAMMSMPSSGDKRAVAELYGDTDDRDMLLAVMRVGQTIPSSGDKSRLLTALAPRYLATRDRSLQRAYFGVARQIPSSGDMRRVLETATAHASGAPEVAADIIDVARTIPSSGDRSAVLITLIRSGAVQSRELREAIESAAAEIPSQGDRDKVLLAAARQ